MNTRHATDAFSALGSRPSAAHSREPRAEGRGRRLWIAALLLATACVPGRPPDGALTVARLRTTNETADADARVLDEVAERLRVARAPGAGAGAERDYAAAAAAEWVAFARDAYAEDPRGPAVDEAFDAAARLVERLEAGASRTELASAEAELSRVTRLAVERPRLDLWVDAHAMRDDTTGWYAAAPVVGELEVVLVRIAHAAAPAPEAGARRDPCFVDALVERASKLRELALARARATHVVQAPPPVVVAPVAAPPVAVPVAAPAAAPVAALDGAVHFAVNSAALSAHSRARLDSVARSLAAHGRLRLVIEGYTDPRGSRAYNAMLSRRRAEAVARYLTAAGLDLSSASLRAMGAAATAKNATREEMAKARRVNLRFFESSGREVEARRDAGDLQIEAGRPQRAKPAAKKKPATKPAIRPAARRAARRPS